MLKRADRSEWIPAQVPGSVFSALIEAGILPEPYYRENERVVKVASYFDYEYRVQFSVPKTILKEEKVELGFEGIDTLGEIFLNGLPVGHTSNMHHSYMFDIKRILSLGENQLSILLRSPSRFAEQQHARLPLRSPHGSMVGSAYLRKAHYMFGWDWGPQLPDMGIWKPVYLRAYSHPLISEVRFRQEHEKSRVLLGITVWIEGVSKNENVVEVELEEPTGDRMIMQEQVSNQKVDFQIVLSKPALWYPNGFGKQPLYRIFVRLRKQREVLDEKVYRIGLRRIVLDRSLDRNGRSFRFLVNGIPIFIKGSDFIPMDNILSRQTPERIHTLVEDCAQAHFNMIRIWGGGTYPEEALLDACDEQGILVWQDLMFACMLYELNPEFLESIRQEVTEQVKRIRHRACLALWCGNNEIEWMMQEGRFNAFLNPKLKADYYRLFECVLPDLVRSLDPVTPYWGSSPSSGYDSDDPNDARCGDMHYWEVWHALKPFSAYRTVLPRFMSEFGIQSFPTLPTIESFTEPGDRNIFSPVMESHQKNTGANGRIFHYIGETFRFPKDFRSLVYLSQLVQAEGIRCGVEHWRRHRDVCGGTLYWQLNDCWPGASWSSIDYYGRWKALHYSARRFFAPILMSLVEDGFRISFHVTNDTTEIFEGTCRWKLCLNTGECLKEDTFSITIFPFTSCKFEELDISKALSDKISVDWERRIFLRYVFEDKVGNVLQQDSILFVKPKYFEWTPVHIRWELNEDSSIMILKSSGYTKFVELSTRKREIRFQDNFFDLYPEEERTIRILGRGTELKREDILIFSIFDSFV